MALSRKLFLAKLEERDDLLRQLLGRPEALREEHDLADQRLVWLGHGQTAEQLLQVVRKVGTAGVAGVHGDEDGHVSVDGDLFKKQTILMTNYDTILRLDEISSLTLCYQYVDSKKDANATLISHSLTEL